MAGVGIVGFGYWGPNYLRVLRLLDEVTTLSVCDSDPKQLSVVTNPSIKKYAHYNDLLKDPSLNVVIIATPAPTHFDLGKQALEAGKHIMIEKPMALRARDAQELQILADKKNKVLSTGHIFLYNDGIDFLKRHIHTKEFGKIHEIECVRQGHGPIRTEINAMWDLATHDISILLYLLEQNPVAVSAHGFKYRKDTCQEDSVTMILRFNDEVQTSIKVNWQYPIKERRVTVIGEKQMIRFNDTETTSPIAVYYKSVEPHGEISNSEYGSFKMITSDAGCHLPTIKIREPLVVQIQDFFEAIRTNRTPKSDGILGMNVVRILEAAQKSLEQNGMMMQV